MIADKSGVGSRDCALNSGQCLNKGSLIGQQGAGWSEGRWIVGKRRWIRRYWVHQDARRVLDVLMGAGVKIMASGD